MPDTDKRTKRLRAGLCGNCGGRPPKRGTTKCTVCLAKTISKIRERRAKLKQQNLCQYCGSSPARKGKASCSECGARNCQYAKNHRSREREAT